MYRYATGWLGWTPEIALNTPVPLIMSALDGKIEFLKISSGSSNSGAEKTKTFSEKFRDFLKVKGTRRVVES